MTKTPDWMEPLDLDLGFSGTRQDPTKLQKDWLLEEMLNRVRHGRVKTVHHGCCIGADAFFHRVAKSILDMGLEGITLHPPTDRSKEMEITEWDLGNCLWYPRKPYLQRNREIVRSSSQLLALPATIRPTRGSGTWYTIKNAIATGKSGLVCFPHGEVVDLKDVAEL